MLVGCTRASMWVRRGRVCYVPATDVHGYVEERLDLGGGIQYGASDADQDVVAHVSNTEVLAVCSGLRPMASESKRRGTVEGHMIRLGGAECWPGPEGEAAGGSGGGR